MSKRFRRRSRPLPGSAAGWALPLVLAVGTFAVGCGLSTHSDPEPLASENLPEDLQPGGTTTTVAPAAHADDVGEVQVWFLIGTDSDVTLEPITREVPQPANLDIVLEALFDQPPDDNEREAGITSAIPPDTVVDSWELSGDVLVLELSQNFFDRLEGETSRNAFAQVVYTATSLPNVRLVQFALAGEIIEAKDGEGEDRIEPLGRNDYASLAPGPIQTSRQVANG